MNEESRDAARNFIEEFTHIHRTDRQAARVLIISCFATTFAMFEVKDRLAVLDAILALARDINTVIFEDGSDFVTYLVEESKKYV